MSKTLKIVSIKITKEQYDFIRENEINLSKLVRSTIEKTKNQEVR